MSGPAASLSSPNPKDDLLRPQTVRSSRRAAGSLAYRHVPFRDWDGAPIPGTKRVDRVEENIAADMLELSAEQLDKLDDLTPPAGDHHNEAQMRMIDR